MSSPPPRTALAPAGHALYELGPDLLLVFKPRGHCEPQHTHDHGQRLRVLRGSVRIDTHDGRVVLSPASAPFTLAAGQAHATEALADAWLVAEAT